MEAPLFLQPVRSQSPDLAPRVVLGKGGKRGVLVVRVHRRPERGRDARGDTAQIVSLHLEFGAALGLLRQSQKKGKEKRKRKKEKKKKEKKKKRKKARHGPGIARGSVNALTNCCSIVLAVAWSPSGLVVLVFLLLIEKREKN